METFIIFGMTLSILWVALTLLFIISLISEASESGWWATLGFICFCLALYFWDKNVFSQMIQKWTWIPIYLGIGFIFASIRFYFYGRKKRPKLIELKDAYLKKNKIAVFTEEHLKEFQGDYEVKELLSPDDFKEHAFRYWLNWPGSLVWWVLSDILKDIWNFIYDLFKNWFKKIYLLGLASTNK